MTFLFAQFLNDDGPAKPSRLAHLFHEITSFVTVDNIFSLILAAGAYIGASIAFNSLAEQLLAALQNAAKRTETKADDEIIRIFVEEKRGKGIVGIAQKFILLFVCALVLYEWGVLSWDIVGRMAAVAESIVVWRLAVLGWRIMMVFLNEYLEERQKGKPESEANSERNMASNLMMILEKCYLFIAGLFIVENFLGLNVSALVSLGSVGGLAVALSTQAVLADLIAGLIVFLDEPFKVGDVIIVVGGGDTKGTVKAIGFRHTEINHPDGERLVVANKDLASAKIKIMTSIPNRRLVISLKLSRSATPEQMRALPDILKEAVEGVPNCQYNVAYMKDHLGWANEVELIWYGKNMDALQWRKAQHLVNVNIAEALDKAGIEFGKQFPALPAATLV